MLVADHRLLTPEANHVPALTPIDCCPCRSPRPGVGDPSVLIRRQDVIDCPAGQVKEAATAEQQQLLPTYDVTARSDRAILRY
jgi:hypothetical protein